MLIVNNRDRGHPIVDVVVDPLIGDKLRPHQKE